MRIGIIGGTGLEERLIETMGGAGFEAADVETPFGETSARIRVGAIEDQRGEPIELALLSRHGEGHVIPPHKVPARANIFAMKALGVTHVIATGACGSLREDVRPGELMICDQLIDRTVSRPRTFFDEAAVHVEFAEPYCPVMRAWLIGAAERIATTVHGRGTMVVMEGPAFSTRAESELHRQMGADVVGMTALPEAKLAREAEMAYATIALPTDYDCWRKREDGADEASLLEEIMGNLKRASDSALELIGAALGDVSSLRNQASPAHEALKLAIWSDKARIDAAVVERLRAVWGRRFGG